MNDLQRYLRTSEAAAFCGISPRTLEKLRSVGGGPRFVRPQGCRFVRYAVDDLEEWLNSGLQESMNRAGFSGDPVT